MKRTFSGANLAFREIDSKRTISYDEFEVSINNFCAWITSCGIKPEEKIAIYCADKIEFQVIFWGCLRTGVVPVLINHLISKDEVEYIIKDSNPKLAFVSDGLECDGVKNIQIESLFQILPLGVQYASSKNFFIECNQDADAFMLYTSGSTGKPKGVVHTRRSINTAVNTYKVALKLTSEDRVLCLSKMGFSYGFGSAISTLMCGATVVLYEQKINPAILNSIINSANATVLCSVPTLYSIMASRGVDLTGIKCISAGEPLKPALRNRLNADITDTWGATEVIGLLLIDGVPCNTDVKLVDDELWVAPEALAIRYHNHYENTKEKFVGRWYRSGDVFREENGVYYYEGRNDDMFKVRGAWVSPTELEDILNSHEFVEESAVVGKIDNDGLLKPFAYVVPNATVEKDELRRHVIKHLHNNHKRLVGVDFVDSIPKTATGKIQRYKFK